MPPAACLLALSLSFLLSSTALAQARRSERLQAQSQKLAAVETQLNPYDQQTLDRLIAGIDRVLRGYQGGAAASLTCLSDGQPGTYERFKMTDTATGAALAKPTTLDNCKQLVAVQNHGLICVSNGEPGTYEKFGLYDLGRKAQKGGFSDLKTCLTLVQRASASFVCHSNNQPGSYEKFHFYNRDTDKPMGGDTQLDQCTGAIPN